MWDFREELVKFLKMINNWENFALARYGDWEKMLMCWEEVGKWTQAEAQDHWTSPNGMTELWTKLKETLDIDSPNYYYAIPCKCCNEKWKKRYFDNIKSRNFTFANLFINNNYEIFKEWLSTIKREVNVIANYEWRGKEYPFKVKQYMIVWDDCVNYFAKSGTQSLNVYKEWAKGVQDELFFISAWPLANIYVYEMYKANPNNTYIDVWSAIDERTKGRITRWFQRPEDFYAKRFCEF